MTPIAYARSLARILAPYRGTAALGGPLLRVDLVFSAAWPLSFKFLIDRITQAGDPRFLPEVVGALFAAVLVASLAALFVSDIYPAAQNAVYQGEIGDRFHLIARGRVEVLRQEGDGEPARVAVPGAGDYFGEIALLRRGPRMATVRTRVPTLRLLLKDRHFQMLLPRHPEVAESLRRDSAVPFDERLGAGNGAGGP